MAVPMSPREGPLTSALREWASRQNVSGAPSTASRLANVPVSFICLEDSGLGLGLRLSHPLNPNPNPMVR